MSNPKLELTMSLERGRHVWRLLEDWTFAGVTVPAGFETDLGSIPRAFWWLVGPQEIAHGAIIHDYRYVVQDVPKSSADKELRDNIQYFHEVGRIRAYLVYLAVKLFGRY